MFTARYERRVLVRFGFVVVLRTGPRLRRSVAGHSQWGHMFGARSVHMKFVVNQAAAGQMLLPVLVFSPVSINPSMLHIHLHVAVTRRTNGRSLGTFSIKYILEIGVHWIEVHCL